MPNTLQFVTGTAQTVSFTVANPTGVTLVEVRVDEPNCVSGWVSATWVNQVATFPIGVGSSFPVSPGVWPLYVRSNGQEIEGPYKLRVGVL